MNSAPLIAATVQDDPRPELIEPSVELVGKAGIVTATVISVTLNVYAHLHGHLLNPAIGWVVGIGVPLLVAFVAHVAAHVRFHWTVKGWIFAVSAVLMYVSAAAGTSVLRRELTLGPALAASIGADLAALTLLGFLMYATDRKTDLKAWQKREDERVRQAQTADTVARYSRMARPVTVPGNSVSNAAGNTAPPVTGNTPPAELAVTAPNPVLPPDSPVIPVAGDDSEAQGSGHDAEVIDLRPVPTEEEMRVLARALYAETGKLSVRLYRERHRGSQKKVAAAVAAVKAELGLIDDDDTAATAGGR
jgi:hypothetical protein